MGKTLLVVDADAKTRKAVIGMLTPLGVKVKEAEGPAGLADAAESAGAHVILLDLMSDPKAAFRAVDELKSRPQTMEVQVLGMSRHLDVRHTAGATEHGFEDFVSKPIDEKELLPILRFHLDLPHGLNDAHPR
jgi:CheY-like chemotaxis protein